MRKWEALVKSIMIAGGVGVLATGLVVGVAAPALAKATVSLSADHKVVKVGRVVKLKGYYGSDSGDYPRTRFCFQLRTAPHRWTQVGTCVKPYWTNNDSADYEAYYALRIPMLAKGRYTFRGYPIEPPHYKAAYTSDPITVTVH
jgi:hypothetical protein